MKNIKTDKQTFFVNMHIIIIGEYESVSFLLRQ